MLKIILSIFLSFPFAAIPHEGRQLPFIKDDSVNKSLLLALVNNARRKGVTCKGVYYAPVAPLTWNDALERAALNHSRDMDKKNYFSHISPDGSDVTTRLEQAGYDWKNYGENIGMGYGSEKEVVEGWLGSPAHCKNIMSQYFKEMGVAKAGSYWTQDFGTR